MDLRIKGTLLERRVALEKQLGIHLEAIGNGDATDFSHVHCENLIGFTQIPLGIAGPLQMTSAQFGTREYYLPLSATEGALVASINRGCKAITVSGGVNVITEKVGMTRAPVFIVENILEGKKFCEWLIAHVDELKKIIASSSTHITLLSVTPYMIGQYVYARFVFDTQDAMGMNMVTIALNKVTKYIEEKTQARCVALSGNMCVDKKPNFLNFIEGRGTKVWAEVLLPKDVVRGTLKTTIKDFIMTGKAKLLYGSILSGSIGANAHMANVLSAFFLATGQDLAHIAECSSGITQVDEKDGGLYISIYLPDLVIGTVGGGTELPTQNECLKILGIEGGNEGKHALQFAEIVGGAVLAGEISLLAALSSGDLATAHAILGRGRKT